MSGVSLVLLCVLAVVTVWSAVGAVAATRRREIPQAIIYTVTAAAVGWFTVFYGLHAGLAG